MVNLQKLCFSEVKAAKMPKAFQEYDSGSLAITTGWGVLDENGTAADRLQTVETYIIGDDECKHLTRHNRINATFKPSGICTMHNKGQSPCYVNYLFFVKIPYR